MIQRRDRLRFQLESFAVAFGRDLDSHHAPQSRVGCAINGSHAARADLRFDLIRAELDPGGDHRFCGIRQRAAGQLVQNLAVGFHFQHSLHAKADFGIGTAHQRRALGGTAILGGVI